MGVLGRARTGATLMEGVRDIRPVVIGLINPQGETWMGRCDRPQVWIDNSTEQWQHDNIKYRTLCKLSRLSRTKN